MYIFVWLAATEWDRNHPRIGFSTLVSDSHNCCTNSGSTLLWSIGLLLNPKRHLAIQHNPAVILEVAENIAMVSGIARPSTLWTTVSSWKLFREVGKTPEHQLKVAMSQFFSVSSDAEKLEPKYGSSNYLVAHSEEHLFGICHTPQLHLYPPKMIASETLTDPPGKRESWVEHWKII